MKKSLLILAASFAALSLSASNYELSLDELSVGWSSSYDASTKTITYDGAWGARGWEFSGVTTSDYSQVVVEFAEATSIPVKLYLASGWSNITDAEVSVEAGVTSISLDLDSSWSFNQVFLQEISGEAGGTLVLSSAYLVEGSGSGSGSTTVENYTLALDAVNIGWGATYDESSYTVTYAAGNWGAIYWNVGTSDLSTYTKVVVEFANAIEIPVKLYLAKDWNVIANADAENFETSVEAGATKVEVAIDPDYTFNMVFLQTGTDAEGAVALSDAYLEAKLSSVISTMAVDDSDAPVEYYTLQGIRVANPTPGTIVIRRQGSHVTKIKY
ncbi:MAG: hypothetical protein LIP02_09870 [Bacteroidales bacterium]|nr:hypothetical protein [Bacteroidales bacterium]